MESFNNIDDTNIMGSTGLCNSDRRIVNSGKNGTKRSVSETKKKYVAENIPKSVIWISVLPPQPQPCPTQTLCIDHPIRLL